MKANGTALGCYWWSPRRSPTPSAKELVRRLPAWTTVAAPDRHLWPFNFGDEVAPLLVRELTEMPVRWAPIRRADLVCVGSILDEHSRAGSHAAVLGAGIRDPAAVDRGSVREDRVHLVRGRLSAAQLGIDETTPVGDPALVLSNIIEPVALRRRNGVVLIPHFSQLNTRQGRGALRSARSAGIEVVLPNSRPLDVAREVAKAELVLTGSLHGLVFADALGTPAQLTHLTGRTSSELLFKYADHNSAFGLESSWLVLGPALETFDKGALMQAVAHRTEVVSSKLADVVEGIYEAGRSYVSSIRVGP